MRIISRMSAFGPKQTCACAPHMSAFGCKADMTVCGCLLSRSLLGVRHTHIDITCVFDLSDLLPPRLPPGRILPDDRKNTKSNQINQIKAKKWVNLSARMTSRP